MSYVFNTFMQFSTIKKILVSIVLILLFYLIAKLVSEIFDNFDVKKGIRTILWLSEERYCTIITSEQNDKKKVILEVASHVDDSKKDKPAAYIAVSNRRLHNFREAIDHCRSILKKRNYDIVWTQEMGDPVIVLSPKEHEWED